ncbi:MAG: hypothetical protein R3B89_02665 [Polyangiaceae bacterium]
MTRPLHRWSLRCLLPVSCALLLASLTGCIVDIDSSSDVASSSEDDQTGQTREAVSSSEDGAGEAQEGKTDPDPLPWTPDERSAGSPDPLPWQPDPLPWQPDPLPWQPGPPPSRPLEERSETQPLASDPNAPSPHVQRRVEAAIEER